MQCDGFDRRATMQTDALFASDAKAGRNRRKRVCWTRAMRACDGMEVFWNGDAEVHAVQRFCAETRCM